ncbi:mRNA cleavage and polyadenylation factor subunit, partial [Serendipita sp. 399]
DLLVVLANGAAIHVHLDHEGRLVRKLVAEQQIGKCPPPSVVITEGPVIFIGSVTSHSVVLDCQKSGPQKLDQTGDGAHLHEAEGQEDDIDLIWSPERARLTILPSDTIEDPGSFIEATFCQRPYGEPALLATSGLDDLGGFTIFNKRIPTRLKKKIPAIAGRRGIWSMRLDQDVRGGHRSTTGGPPSTHDDNVLFSTDMTPVPGASRIASKSQARLDVNITSRLPMLTVAIAPFFSRSHLLQVTTNSLRLLTPDGSEKQVIKDTDGSTPRAKIRSASILDPYILILREDDTLGLFIGEPSRGKVRRKDMSALGDKQKARYFAASFYDDQRGQLQVDEGDARITMNSPAPSPSHWLVLCSFMDGPPVLQAEATEPNNTAPDAPIQADIEITDAVLADLGETMTTPHLFILFKTGLLFIYQITPIPSASRQKQGDGRSHSSLNIQFVKKMVQQLTEKETEEMQLPSVVGADKKPSRNLIPFKIVDQQNVPKSAVFLTGEDPRWIMKGDKTDVMFMHSDYTVVYAFTSCSMWDSTPTFLMNTEEGTSLVEWTPGLSFHGQFAFERIRKGRTYSNIAFDTTTGLIIAASSVNREFILFDDEGNNIWERDSPNVSYPALESVALELIDPSNWATIDG